MQTSLQGVALAQAARRFVAAIQATNFDKTINLKCIIKALPDVRLRKGYTLGSYRIGDFWGSEVKLYPFRKGSKSEYDPGEIHRDIENYDMIWLHRNAKDGDPEAIRLLEERNKPVLPFADGQYVSGCLSLEAEKTVPVLKDYLDVDFTPMSIWQSMLLLEASSNYLPHGWHGGYLNGKIILDADDLKHAVSYSGLQRSQWEPFLNAEGLIPSVTMLGETKAYVHFCRWGNWRGLDNYSYYAYREGRTIRFEREPVVNLIQYDCGICF